MEIGEPSLLAKLPRAGGQNGRFLISQTFGLRSGVKRKRQEICAAVDGSSVGVYEVLSGRLLSSYPVSPDTSFECAPHSVRSKTETGKVARRTYCVVKRHDETHVRLFTEQETGAIGGAVSTTDAQLVDSSHAIIQLETVCLSDVEPVVVTRNNGRFDLISGDLSSQRGSVQLHIPGKSGVFVATYCASITEAAGTILKSRPDIVATAGRNTVFAAGILSCPIDDKNEVESLEYGVWQLSVDTFASPDAQLLAPIVSHTLISFTPPHTKDEFSAVFVAKRARLLLKSQSKSIIFDLASTIPRKLSDLPTFSHEQISSVDISDRLVLNSSSGGLHLYNSIFRSVQASLDLSRNALKRRLGSQPAGPVMLIAYFPQLNRAIATRRNSLVGIDLRLSQHTDMSSALKQSSMLISNIGKGIPSADRLAKSAENEKKTALGNINANNVFTAGWSSTVKRLEECLLKQDVQGFEHIFLDHISSKSTGRTVDSPNNLPIAQARYVLAKIFQSRNIASEQVGSERRTLEIVFPALRLVQWLAVQGYLTTENVRGALVAGSRADSSWTLSDGALALALVEHDTSFYAIYNFLLYMPQADLVEVCTTVRALIRRAVSQASLASAIHGVNMSSDNPQTETGIATVSSSQIETNDNSLTNVLTTALEKLCEGSNAAITSALRACLNQQDLISLIQFLRQRLYYSGYTRSVQSQSFPSPHLYTCEGSNNSDTPGNDQVSLSLDATLTVLSSCVDVIGPLGMISSGDEMDFVQTLIPELSSEIERTMEALHDTAYLQGLLRETLRYSESIRKTRPGNKKSDNKDPVKGSGSFVTLYAEPAIEGDLSSSFSALPLSLQMESKINGQKVRKGGGQVSERSRREMGMLQDRLRGPYAMERLVL